MDTGLVSHGSAAPRRAAISPGRKRLWLQLRTSGFRGGAGRLVTAAGGALQPRGLSWAVAPARPPPAGLTERRGAPGDSQTRALCPGTASTGRRSPMQPAALQPQGRLVAMQAPILGDKSASDPSPRAVNKFVWGSNPKSSA